MILEWSLRVTLLAAGAGAVLLLLRVSAAAVRHLAWTGVMLAMLLLVPLWVVWGPRIPIALLPSLPAVPLLVDLDLIAPTPPVMEGFDAPAKLPNEPKPAGPTWQMIGLGAYLLVTCAMLLRLIQATLWTRKIARGPLTSPAVSTPITVGWFRPVMLLPEQWAEWPAAQRDAVLLHEQEHVRRRDPLIRWLSLLNRALFWFHPLAWWLERKLATLAEEACDAVVLASGHSPAAYANYLIDVARSVEQAGGRVRLHFAFGDANAFSKRVQRILREKPAPPLSRLRSIAAAALGGVVLVISVACTLDRRESPAPGQPTMVQLREKRAKANEERNSKEKALAEEVRTLNPEQARDVEAKLKANPDDPPTYRKMVLYYQRVKDLQGLDALTLWYIEHQPDTKVFPGRINPEWDRAGYERGKALWLANLKKPGASPQMYYRAATFLEVGDPPLAEQVLLDGRKARPGEVGSELGRLYARVLLGTVGGTNEVNVPRGISMQAAHGPFARSVLAKLNGSQDTGLLTLAAQSLMMTGSQLATRSPDLLDFDPLALAKSLIDRALSIQPQLSSALRQKVDVEDLAASMRLRNVAPEQMSDADRMLWLRRSMEYGSAPGEKEARELVTLAARLPENPESANALFFGNQTLGRFAMKRWDRKEAVRFLRASAAATPTDRLRFKEIDMTLARELVDAGERTAVAEFLERLAQFNQQPFQPFAKWAAEIRQGMNPELTPFFTGG